MPPHPTAQIAALGIEPTYSAREAAHLLRRSYSWLDQRLRQDQFIRPDGTTVQPLRTQGGYRRFTLAMLEGRLLPTTGKGEGKIAPPPWKGVRGVARP